MKLGALLGPVMDPQNANALTDQAKELEREGYDSIWSAQAMGRGFMITDPFVALSAAAAVTNKVEIGTAILQLPHYHAAELAQRVFSLMQLCGDRFTFGVGAGSTEADFGISGADFQTRFKAFNKDLASLRTYFETGTENGVDLAPWPTVKGGPPIIYGTWGKGVARAAKEFDGWIASGMHRTVDDLSVAIKDYRAAGGKRAIVTTIQLSQATDIKQTQDLLQQYKDLGFDDAVVMFLPGAPSAAEVRKVVD